MKQLNQNLVNNIAQLVKELKLPVTQRAGSKLPSHQVQYLLPRSMGKTVVSSRT